MVCELRKKDWESDTIVPPVIDDENDAPETSDPDGASTKENVIAVCKQRNITSDLELKLHQYFRDHPHVRALPPTVASLDIDLTDPDEETWIIQCPASVDIEAELLHKKLDLSVPRSTIKNCSVPLEANVQHNTSEQVVGLLAGTRVKSFVPVGFVRINEAIAPLDVGELQATSAANTVSEPYPEVIRVRHPLLGYDYREHLAVPKAVRKQLSFAQQKAALFYQTAPAGSKKGSKKKSKTPDTSTVASLPGDNRAESVVAVKTEPAVAATAKATKSKKRKDTSMNGIDGEVIRIKEEPLSPKRKKQPEKDKTDEESAEEEEVQTVSIKKEVAVEDDISWLLNI
uniref:Uncharacterized protein n=1 Tax=Anopheles dirus TaxID=7168 RepID=A0A182NCP1_9DIPT